MSSIQNEGKLSGPILSFTRYPVQAFLICMMLTAFHCAGIAQAEVEPWGNMAGIRAGGQLIPFETNLSLVNNNWSAIKSTAQERQQPKYLRDGNKQIVTTKIDSVYFIETIEDGKAGTANVNVVVSSKGIEKDVAFFVVALPLADYTSAIINQHGVGAPRTYVPGLRINKTFTAGDVSFISKSRKVEFVFDKPTEIIFKNDIDTTSKTARVYISLLGNDFKKDSSFEKSFTIKASGAIDNRTVTLKLKTSKEGRPFDGFGGNFRLQNPEADPQVIDYCLQNLRVAWGRVEFPWRFWQPEENVDPVTVAKDGKLNPHVQESMEIAARLGKMGIPVILSGWFPPQWAVVGKLNMRPQNGVWGNQLDSTRMTEIYKSITDYILYLKNNYNTNIALFSFNESDLGINVRITPAEHDALIKGLGAYFKSHGLSTKMLLGDNSDATTYQFIEPALNDPDAKPYIGAISFHSWRGCDNETLKKWKGASDELKVPLIVGEGSIDAAAWNYPAIFQEQIYIMQEIDLYIRLLAVCQPLAILQWQFTSDYSPLAGGGIFGDNGPLRPTQRFWNFKQLASTPKGLFAMPITCDRSNITVAATGDNKKKAYAIHIVNNGASRNAVLTGLPASVKSLDNYTTDKKDSDKKGVLLKVVNGTVSFHLNAESFMTLISE